MPFTLGNWTKAKITPFTVGMGTAPAQPPTVAYHFELADQNTSTSPVMQAPTGIAHARAIIRQKGWISGSGTVGPTYELQVAADAAFTQNVRVISRVTTNRAGRDETVVLDGVVPDLETLTFARIFLTLSGTDGVTYDAMVDLSPGV